MKIRWDFVTNSSSTSFVIISNDTPKIENFLDAAGILKGSPLTPLFSELFDVMTNSMKPIRQLLYDRYYNYTSINECIMDLFTDELQIIIKNAYDSGKVVNVGRLSTDDGDLAAFFCVEPFEFIHPDLSVYALNCAW